MPLHRIFHPPEVFSNEDKQAIAERITNFYTSRDLPAFYVNVVFIPVPEASFYVSGKPSNKFVRIVSSHLARNSVTSEQKVAVMDALEKALAPYIKERGLDWELHVENHDRELWRLNGLVAPQLGTEAHNLWVNENRPVPF